MIYDPNNPKAAVLSNRLYVPEDKVSPEILEEWTYYIEYKDESYKDDNGKPILQQEHVEAYSYFSTPEGGYYGLHRGNLPKITHYFKDLEIIDKRSEPELGFDLAVMESTKKHHRWVDEGGQWQMINHWKKHLHGGLRADPGWGKTVFGIGLVCELGVRTLILAHDRELITQWYNRFYEHTNIEDCERQYKKHLIGFYKPQKGFYPITLSTYQALISTKKNRQYIKERSGSFGLTINDEGHHESAESFASATMVFNPKYRCWVTATPERKDGRHVVIYDMVGPIVGEGRDERLMGEVRFVNSGCELNPKQKWVYMINSIVRDKPRNRMLIDLVVQSVLQEDRKVLLITERIKHAKLLLSSISSALGVHDKYAALVVGGVKNLDKIFKKIENDQVHVIVGSNVMNEGKDCKPLDTLIIATPNNNKARTEQQVGRIQRPFTYADGRTKKPLIVYDIIDEGHPAIWACKRTRAGVYEDIGFTIYEGPRPVKDTDMPLLITG